jgi:hypothetical protein
MSLTKWRTEMKKFLLAIAMLAVFADNVNAAGDGSGDGTYLYMCKVGPKKYPVTVNLIQDKLIWLGTTYTHVTDDINDCKVKYTATRNDATIELCVATKGAATLSIAGDEFDCQMPGRK